MAINFPCPHCGQTYKLNDNQVGTKGRCAKCQKVFVVSVPTPPQLAATASLPKPAAAPTPSLRRTDPAPRPDPLTSPIPRQLGRFEVRSKLGQGTFGAVYRAFDAILKREVAIKLPHAAALALDGVGERFLREAEAAAQLHHPNIVPVHDAGVCDGQLYIAAAFIDGQTLQSAMRDQPLDHRRAARLIMKLADALAYAHDKGIVHRDVKPGNVMLDSHDEPYVMDFGLARWEQAGSQLTQDGSLLGTPAYMSPEQAGAPVGKVGPASDQYALGVMLYEMLVGRVPFSDSQLPVVLSKIRDEEAVSPRSLDGSIPLDLETICLKAMSKRPQDRYADGRALAADLRRWLDGEPIQARRLGVFERTVRWARKNKAVAGSLAAVAASLVLVAVVSSTSAARMKVLRDQEAEQRKIVELRQHETEAARYQEQVEREKAAAALTKEEKQRIRAEAFAAREADARTSAMNALENETRARKRSEQAEYTANIRAAQSLWLHNNGIGAWDSLLTCNPSHRGWEHNYLYSQFTKGRIGARHFPSTSIQCAAYSDRRSRIVCLSSSDVYILHPKTLNVESQTPLPKQVKGLESFRIDSQARLAIASSRQEAEKTIVLDLHTMTVVLEIGEYSYSHTPFAVYGDLIALIVRRPNAQNNTYSNVSVYRLSDGKRILAEAAYDARDVYFTHDGTNVVTVNLHPQPSTAVVLPLAGPPTPSAHYETPSMLRKLIPTKCNRFVIGQSDWSMHKWTLHDGREEWRTECDLNDCKQVAVSDDGTRIACLTFDGSLTVRDATNGSLLISRPIVSEYTYRFKPDVSLVFIAETHKCVVVESKCVSVWDFDACAPLDSLKPADTGLRDDLSLTYIHMNESGTRYFAPDKLGLGIYDTASKSKLGTIGTQTQFVADVNSTSEVIIERVRAGVQAWNGRTKMVEWSCSVTDRIDRIELSPDGRYVALKAVKMGGRFDSSYIVILEMRTGREVHKVASRLSYAKCRFSPQSDAVICWDEDRVLAFSATDFSLRWKLEIKSSGGELRAVAIAKDRKLVAICDSDVIRICDAITGDVSYACECNDRNNGGVVAFSPDGRRLLRGARSRRSICVWDIDSRQVLCDIQMPSRSAIEDMRFCSENGNLFVKYYGEPPLIVEASRQLTVRQ